MFTAQDFLNAEFLENDDAVDGYLLNDFYSSLRTEQSNLDSSLN